jgi:hypothetical protein
MSHSVRSHSIRRCGLILACVFAFAPIALAQWNEQVLYGFQGTQNGQAPAGGVVFDKQGNLYGAINNGTVYQLAPPVKKDDPWTETVLYIFKGKNDNNDGMQPSGGLIIDQSGNLYGVTAYGGTGGCILLGILYGCGTVFELSPPQQKGGQWTETILYSFQGGNDGYYPWGNLTFDKSGNLYGATQFGGGKGTSCDIFYQYCGTVVKLSPPKQKGSNWTEKVLHSFAGMTNGKQIGDGANPNGGLVFDGKGAIYGTTYTGGYQCYHGSGEGCGTVFKLTQTEHKNALWTETILHRFKGPDGGNPAAGPVFHGANTLYGTTKGGGQGQYASGTVFKISPGHGGSWKEQVLYTFQDGDDGLWPLSSVVFDKDGNLYGVALGGQKFGGVIFRLGKGTPRKFSVLYNFSGADGAYPESRLILGEDGGFYSTTQGGGTGTCGNDGCGTVFEVSPP